MPYKSSTRRRARTASDREGAADRPKGRLGWTIGAPGLDAIDRNRQGASGSVAARVFWSKNSAYCCFSLSWIQLPQHVRGERREEPLWRAGAALWPRADAEVWGGVRAAFWGCGGRGGAACVEASRPSRSGFAARRAARGRLEGLGSREAGRAGCCCVRYGPRAGPPGKEDGGAGGCDGHAWMSLNVGCGLTNTHHTYTRKCTDKKPSTTTTSSN